MPRRRSPPTRPRSCGRYVTNVEGPVFALVNLPEVVKGALFARYSRSAKSLRRLFLDEFVGELDVSGDAGVDATVGLRRAEELYDRVFLEYGDDSVAQLGGVHLACEQASNVLTKVLEWGRLMAYLEQSTRYVALRQPAGAPATTATTATPTCSSRRSGPATSATWTACSTPTARRCPSCRPGSPALPPSSRATRTSSTASRSGPRRSTRCAACCPPASLSNVGIYGTGQSYEMLLLRMRAHPLPEARRYAELMLEELRKVIPSFLQRVDMPERGGVWTDYLADTAAAHRRGGGPAVARRPGGPRARPAVGCAWSTGTPKARTRSSRPCAIPHIACPRTEVLRRVRALGAEDRRAIVRAYVGERTNRRHRPGRAFERTDYRFDVVSDYGAFRDLQRHRMLTIEWQHAGPASATTMPEVVAEAGLGDRFRVLDGALAGLYDAMAPRFPTQARLRRGAGLPHPLRRCR